MNFRIGHVYANNISRVDIIRFQCSIVNLSDKLIMLSKCDVIERSNKRNYNT